MNVLPKQGVPDLDKKIEGLKRLLDVGNRIELIEAVLSRLKPKDDNKDSELEDHFEDLVGKTQKALSSWKSSLPAINSERGRDEFWQELPAQIGAPNTSPHYLVHASFEEFAREIPSRHQRAKFLNVREDNLALLNPSPRSARRFNPWNENDQTIRANSKIKDARPKDALETFRLDQSLLWRDQLSALQWGLCTADGSYQTFRHCAAALEKALASPFVQEFWGEASQSRVVMLGGAGAPSKDLIILRMLAEAYDRFTTLNRMEYIVLDISLEMLNSTHRDLVGEASKGYGWVEKTVPHYVHGDMLDLQGVEHLFRNEDRGAIYLLTGGTIGNVDEREFLISTAAVAKPGEILLIGASAINSSELLDTSLTRAKETYKSDRIRRLFAQPVGALLTAIESEQSLLEVMATAQIDVVEGTIRGASAVEKSRSVEYSVQVRGVENRVIVVNHTMYDIEAFGNFAKPFGWQLIDHVHVEANPHFQYLVLKKRTSPH